jgi:hypothetical protein
MVVCSYGENRMKGKRKRKGKEKSWEGKNDDMEINVGQLVDVLFWLSERNEKVNWG